MKPEKITEMASIMINARNDGDDVGELLAASLHKAAQELGDVEALVKGRSGSWEADIVRKMAQANGTATAKYIKALATLFVEMGKSGADGGDVLSQAMSEAVDSLGGLSQFAGNSPEWYWDLQNMGRQYSSHWNDGLQ